MSVFPSAPALRERNFYPASFKTHLTGDVVFSAAWAAQSRLASIAIFAFIAFSSLWATMAVMLVWSVAATLAYFLARRCGVPDLLESRLQPASADRLRASATTAISTALRIMLVGPAAFIYTRLIKLEAPGACPRRRACHAMVLGTGLTLFGVTTTHYVLRKSGLEGGQLLRASFLGSLLNVTYRTLFSAALFAGLTHLLTIAGVAHLL